MKKLFLFFFLIIFYIINVNAGENKMILKIEHGNVEIELFQDIAPNHVERIKTLVQNKNMMALYFIESLMVLWFKLAM
jgi:peptidyl-prolyl cis-trans isomerase B (cyclophilin B)